MTTTLPLFWHLSSASKKERVDASVKLISALEQFQSQFVPKDPSHAAISDSEGSDVEENEEEKETEKVKDDGLDALNAQDVSYSIRRLIRGLASPRESSRLGFAVALTELLSRIQTVTASQIVTFIVDGTKTQGSMTGQEERDVLFARLFGLTSVIQSGLLFRMGSLPASGSSFAQMSTAASYEETLSQLVALGEKKSWLRESAWWSIALAVDALKGSDVGWKEDAIAATLRHLFLENKTWTPEKIALGLKLQSHYPNQDWKACFAPVLKNSDFLHSGNLQTLARILKEASIEVDGEKTPGGGSWRPQLHFVWDVLLDQLLPSRESSTQPKGSFEEFYRIVVDESLFSSTASQERKYWGFQVFQKALPRVDQNTMPMLFTKNFMRSWINHLSNRDRYLHKIAQQAANEVQHFTQSNPQLGFALILQLTGVHGSHQFDKLTKTKTVESILTAMDTKGIKEYVDHLFAQVNGSEGKEAADFRSVNARRTWIIDQFGALIRSGSIPKDDEWVQRILDWLALNGLFIVKKKSEKSPLRTPLSIPKPAFSDDLRQACRARLLSCLADLTAQTTVVKSDDKSMKMAAVASDGEFWTSKVLKTIEVLGKDAKHVSALNEVDEGDLELHRKATELISWLDSVSENQTETAKGAELLLSATLLQEHCGEDDGDVEPHSDSLQATIEAVQRMFPQNKMSKKSRKSEVDEPTPEPIDVLVDIIIGFLEKSTAYLRNVSNQAFSLLSGSVKESTIDLILTQLERRKPSELLEDDEEEEMDVDEADGDEDSDDEDEEKNESDESEDEFEDSGNETNEEEVDVELRNRIEEALKINGIEAATGESDEEELMDDDQMLAIDEQLAQVFRSRANERKDKVVGAQREATHFKNRVLDLVDAFVKKQPTSPHILRLIIPLIELMVSSSSDERQLSDKAKGILKSRLGKSKETLSDVDLKDLTTIFNDLHLRARRTHSSEALATISQCSIYLVKTLLHLSAEKIVRDGYQQSLTDFITRKNSALNSNFFQDFIRRYPSTAWPLRNDLLELSGRPVNVYRQCQVFLLLDTMITQIPAMGDIDARSIRNFVEHLQKAILATANDACDEKTNLNTAQMKDIFKVALVSIRLVNRIDSSWMPEIWKAETWRSLSKRLSSSSKYKASLALQKMCEQVIRAAQGQAKPVELSKKSATSQKRKADEVDAAKEPTEETTKVKRKKAKVNKS